MVYLKVAIHFYIIHLVRSAVDAFSKEQCSICFAMELFALKCAIADPKRTLSFSCSYKPNLILNLSFCYIPSDHVHRELWKESIQSFLKVFTQPSHFSKSSPFVFQRGHNSSSISALYLQSCLLNYRACYHWNYLLMYLKFPIMLIQHSVHSDWLMLENNEKATLNSCVLLHRLLSFVLVLLHCCFCFML